MKTTEKIVTSVTQPQQTNVLWHNPETGELKMFGNKGWEVVGGKPGDDSDSGSNITENTKININTCCPKSYIINDAKYRSILDHLNIPESIQDDINYMYYEIKPDCYNVCVNPEQPNAEIELYIPATDRHLHGHKRCVVMPRIPSTGDEDTASSMIKILLPLLMVMLPSYMESNDATFEGYPFKIISSGAVNFMDTQLTGTITTYYPTNVTLGEPIPDEFFKGAPSNVDVDGIKKYVTMTNCDSMIVHISDDLVNSVQNLLGEALPSATLIENTNITIFNSECEYSIEDGGIDMPTQIISKINIDTTDGKYTLTYVQSHPIMSLMNIGTFEDDICVIVYENDPYGLIVTHSLEDDTYTIRLSDKVAITEYNNLQPSSDVYNAIIQLPLNISNVNITGVNRFNNDVAPVFESSYKYVLSILDTCLCVTKEFLVG